MLTLVSQLLVFHSDPGHTQPLLEEPTTHEEEVTFSLPDLGVVCEELTGRNSSCAVGMGGFHVPTFGTIRKQEGEVEGHAIWVQVRNTLETSSSDLDHQIMWVAVGQDADLRQ